MSHSEVRSISKCENIKWCITLQPTCKREETEEPGESGGNSGGPDVCDIALFSLQIHLETEMIDQYLS